MFDNIFEDTIYVFPMNSILPIISSKILFSDKLSAYRIKVDKSLEILEILLKYLSIII